MNDNRAAEIYATIDDIAHMWAKMPDQRLGQLLANALYHEGAADRPELRGLFFVKDDVMMRALRSFVEMMCDDV